MRSVLFWCQGLITRLINWITRQVNWVMKAGFFFVTIGFGGATFFKAESSYQNEVGEIVTISLQKTDTPMLISWGLYILGFIGVFLILYEVFVIIKNRKKITHIAVEHIALRSKISTPLVESVTKKGYSSPTSILINLSSYYENGVLRDPESALQLTIFNIENNLRSSVVELGSKEVTIHYGGTPPVPLGFVAGYLIGSTSQVICWDYNRDKECWHKLDELDDGNQPKVDWSGYRVGAKEVCIKLGISFDINELLIAPFNKDNSLIRVSMDPPKHDSVCCIEKLNRFKSEFRELLNKLTYDNVEKVHIFCAAQSSFNFALGQQIGKNHPECTVYEYVNDPMLANKYPWGITFNGKGRAPFVHR